jgi:hypothetical protein
MIQVGSYQNIYIKENMTQKNPDNTRVTLASLGIIGD